MIAKYKVWDSLVPRRSDAIKIRRIWASVRENELRYESLKESGRFWRFRRNLAYDYQTAKAAEKE